MAHSNVRHTLPGLQGGDDSIGLPVLTAGTGPFMRAKGVPAPEANPALLRAGGLDAKKGGAVYSSTSQAVPTHSAVTTTTSAFHRLAAVFKGKAAPSTSQQLPFDPSSATISAPVPGSFQHVGHIGTGPEGRGLAMDVARVDMAPKMAQQLSSLSEGQAARSSPLKAPAMRKAAPAVPGAGSTTSVPAPQEREPGRRSNAAAQDQDAFIGPPAQTAADSLSRHPSAAHLPAPEAPMRPQKRRLAPVPQQRNTGSQQDPSQAVAAETVVRAETRDARAHQMEASVDDVRTMASPELDLQPAASGRAEVNGQGRARVTAPGPGTRGALEQTIVQLSDETSANPDSVEAGGLDVMPTPVAITGEQAATVSAAKGGMSQTRPSPAVLLRDIQAFDKRRLFQSSAASLPEEASFPVPQDRSSEVRAAHAISPQMVTTQPPQAGVDLMGMLRSKVAARRSSMASSASSTPNVSHSGAATGSGQGKAPVRRASSDDERDGSWSD